MMMVMVVMGGGGEDGGGEEGDGGGGGGEDGDEDSSGGSAVVISAAPAPYRAAPPLCFRSLESLSKGSSAIVGGNHRQYFETDSWSRNHTGKAQLGVSSPVSAASPTPPAGAPLSKMTPLPVDTHSDAVLTFF